VKLVLPVDKSGRCPNLGGLMFVGTAPTAGSTAIRTANPPDVRRHRGGGTLLVVFSGTRARGNW
jgi:hypothetical protein